MDELNFNTAVQNAAQNYLKNQESQDNAPSEEKSDEVGVVTSPMRDLIKGIGASKPKDADGSFQIGKKVKVRGDDISERRESHPSFTYTHEDELTNAENAYKDAIKAYDEAESGSDKAATKAAKKAYEDAQKVYKKARKAYDKEYDAFDAMWNQRINNTYHGVDPKTIDWESIKADDLVKILKEKGFNTDEAVDFYKDWMEHNGKGRELSDVAKDAIYSGITKQQISTAAETGSKPKIASTEIKEKAGSENRKNVEAENESLEEKEIKKTDTIKDRIKTVLSSLSDESRAEIEKIAKNVRGLMDGTNEEYAENLPKGYYGEYKNLKNYYLSHGYNEKDAKKEAGLQIGHFILDGLGTSLMNASAIIKGGEASQQSQLQQIQQERLKGAMDRYNKKRDEAMSSELELFKKYAGDNADLISKWESLMANSYYRTLATSIDAQRRIRLYKLLAEYAKDIDMNDIGNLLKIAAADKSESGELLNDAFGAIEKGAEVVGKFKK